MENFLTLQIVLAIAGCVALLAGLFGGGIKAKELEVPRISASARLFSSLVGMLLIGVAIQLPSLAPQAPEPTPTPIPSVPQSITSVLPTATDVPTAMPTNTPTNTPPSPTATYTPPPTATYAAPPPTATSTPSPVSLQIPSDYYGWIDTGIEINLGQAIQITASGRINIYAGTPRAETDPNGNYGFDCSTCIVKTEPVGLLLGRIGRPGNPIFRIGTGAQVTAGSSGRLFLLINDCCFQDNIGSFSVTVIFH